jgi:hypothetical protein
MKDKKTSNRKRTEKKIEDQAQMQRPRPTLTGKTITTSQPQTTSKRSHKPQAKKQRRESAF